jgi:hypothetical protein
LAGEFPAKMKVKITFVQWLGINSDFQITRAKIPIRAILYQFFDHTGVLSIVPDPLDNVGYCLGER